MAELEQEEMSFWDHLEALRWTLFRSFLAALYLCDRQFRLYAW